MPDAATAPFAFLGHPGLARLLALLNTEGEEARVVGGAVRNALMGLPVTDIDIATTALPAEVMRRVRQAGLRAVPTGIDHGTITVLAGGTPFEVTTLREDLETDGRHAVVRFGRSWQRDAERRDFTMNALYLTGKGEVVDQVGGMADLRARRVRFIGDAETRIAEDRLRVLRFFRFQAAYGSDAVDPVSLSAAVKAKDSLDRLSAERIGAEVVKLVRARGAPAVLRLMATHGVADAVFGGPIDVETFAGLHDLVGGDADAVPVRLAALVDTPERGRALAERLRLSNAQRDRMVAVLSAVEPPMAPLEARDVALVRRVLFRLGPKRFTDTVPVVAARLRLPDRAAFALASLPPPGPLPITSADLKAHGVLPGPAFGAALARATEVWIASDFTASKDAVLRAALESGGPTGSGEA